MNMNAKKSFITASVVCLALQIIGVIISIVLAMPAQVAFGDQLLSPTDATSATVAKAFLTNGTALAPPLMLMIIFALLLLAARRIGKWGTFGTALLSLLGLLFTFATLGEYNNPDRFTLVSGNVYVTLLLVNQASITAVTVLGVLTLITQIRKGVRSSIL
ncbi:hypothetical protein ASG89_20705 [Paenibacillus sp. Soil766]|uniref:hypothetical protein n=1 Tax=Paenibacillus sp. Soil766 TaxID=1736404 RepID=UPI0007109331|nr:hypothetical protein [Paenibacillus sp. Soil766]KRF05549.1 hypothetical protein ASG89_20705 [Paenibacillus sp. Soil766]